MPFDVAPSLADVLTLAGAAVSAALVTTFVELLKVTKGVGPVIRIHELEQTIALLAAMVLVIFASIDRHATAGATTLNDVFVSVVAWLAIAKLATGLHDEATAAPGSLREKTA